MYKVCLTLVLGAALLLAASCSQVNTAPSNQNPSPTWKTYRNNQYRFTIQYPSTLTAVEHKGMGNIVSFLGPSPAINTFSVEIKSGPEFDRWEERTDQYQNLPAMHTHVDEQLNLEQLRKRLGTRFLGETEPSIPSGRDHIVLVELPYAKNQTILIRARTDNNTDEDGFNEHYLNSFKKMIDTLQFD